MHSFLTNVSNSKDLLQVDLQHMEAEVREKDVMVDRVQKQLQRIQDQV